MNVAISCCADRHRVGLTVPNSRDLGTSNDQATVSWSVKFVDSIRGAPDSATHVRTLDVRGKDMLEQVHCFIPANGGGHVSACVTEGGARAWHLFCGIGAMDEALHIKARVPMGAEFASEIGA